MTVNADTFRILKWAQFPEQRFFLIFSLKTAGQCYSSQIIVHRVATLSTIWMAGDGRGTGTEWSAHWGWYLWTDHHTDSLWSGAREICLPVKDFPSERARGRKQRSTCCKRRVEWTPWSQWSLVQWRENGGRRVEHGRWDDVTVVLARFRGREGWGRFVLDLVLAPSCAAVLEPNLK